MAGPERESGGMGGGLGADGGQGCNYNKQLQRLTTRWVGLGLTDTVQSACREEE